MALTNETVRTLLREFLGADFGPAEVERLRPLIERQLDRMRELRELDLGGDDPRSAVYITDRRITQ